MNQTENLNQDTSDAESAKIGIVEIVPLAMLVIMSDVAEAGATLIGGLVSGTAIGAPIGYVIWLMAVSFGFFVSTILVIWSLFRGGGLSIRSQASKIAKRIVTLVAGEAADKVTGGFLPMRTISFFIAVWLTNHTKKGTMLQKTLKIK